LPPPPPRYDLPPGSRRLLTRVGPLTAETGGLPVNAFGVRGQYATTLMNAIDGPILSRWSSILLRRALLSGVDTPPSVNGADFAAARAGLLLRMGEANGARMIVQSVDIDRASQRLRQTALQVFLANGDPGGLCPYVPAMDGPDRSWNLVKAMCSAIVAEPGSANAIVESVRRSRQLAAIDVKLAEKIVGAGANSRRAATVRWDEVTQLTTWRFGLANAAGVEIPANLWGTATPAMRNWAVQSSMIPVEARMPYTAGAAATGVLSARAYVDLVSFAASRDGAPEPVETLAAQVRSAFVLSTVDGRVQAIAGLAGADGRNYAGRVLGARAAARIAPVDVSDDAARTLIAAMFAGGLDNNAMAWAPRISVGSQAWGLLAVGSPRPLASITAGQVDDFKDADDSTNTLRTRFLAAALIGLGRIDEAGGRELANDLNLGLATETSWTRAIDEAATRGETGMVALLAGVGLRGRGWDGVPPYHIYRITRALRQVGLGAEARMIAAEALTRV
jgi:hypothetical protein